MKKGLFVALLSRPVEGRRSLGPRWTENGKRRGAFGSDTRNRLACSVVLVALTFGCKHDVTRISNGSTRHERPISAAAYAAFGRARLLERAGDVSGAISAYREVLNEDDDAAEAYVRIGALLCQSDPAEAARAFVEAARLAPHLAELHSASAECALQRGKWRQAVAAAERAFELSPDQRTSLLLVDAYQAATRGADAKRLAWAHVAVYPNDTLGWSKLAELARDAPSLAAQIRHRAARRVPADVRYSILVDGAKTAGPQQGPMAPVQIRGVVRFDRHSAAELDLDAALFVGDTRAIHAAARNLRLSAFELIVRAMDVGALEFARSQAALVGKISPNDATVWQLRLRLADLLGDDAEFEALLAEPPEGNAASGADADFEELFSIILRRTGFSAEHRPPP